MNEAYVKRFGNELKLVKDGAISGKYEHDVDMFFAESQLGLGSVIEVRNAFYDNAEHVLGTAYSSARFSFLIALAVLACGSGSQRRADHDGSPPRLQADRRPHRHHVAACQRRRIR